MVEMTRLNGHTFLVNADLIKHVEAIPDTTLTLVTGEKLVVLERCEDILVRTLAWRASILREAWPAADTALLANSAHLSANSAHHSAHTAHLSANSAHHSANTND